MSKLLDRNHSMLVVIDVQERLYPSICEHERMLSRIDLLLSAAGILKVPVVLTEQYPKGLGRTIEEIRKALPEVQPIEKMEFSCVSAPGFRGTIKSLHRDQILLAGIEAHVCVAQTALDLASMGENVFICADAISSRRPLDLKFGLKRLSQNGMTLITAESVVFEWLRCAGTDEFKALQPKLKALP